MAPTYEIFNQDCVTGMAERLAPDSIDLCVTSIPFGSLFSYSGKTEDVGNNVDGVDMRGSQFGLHFRFFVAQLLRVMAPGCVVAVHIQQLVATKVQHGAMGRRDFRGAVVDLFGAGGFDWTGEIVIPKNPQVIAQRQKLHSLLFITGKRDARALAPAVNDFILVFRKPGEGAPVPSLYDPEINPGGWVTTDEWIRDARGVWTDIRETDVVEGWREVLEEGDERHVCPLQLEVIRRLVRLYSAPGATVMDPFSGVGSTGAVCMEQDRHYKAFELKESYWRKSIKICEMALARRHQEQTLPLFAGLDVAV